MSDNSGIITVTNVQSETDACASSSTACVPKRGNGMSKALLIDEYSASDIPPPVSMIFSTLENSTIADLTVVVLYLLTVECGFVILGTESEPGDDSCQFNVKRVRTPCCLPPGWKDSEGIYRLSFILKPFPNEICKLVCIPVNDKLITNMILTGSFSESYSMIVETTDFFGKITNSPPQVKKLKTLKGCPGEEVTSSKDTVTAKSDRTSHVTQSSQDTTIHHCNGDIGKKQNGAATRSNSVGPDRTPSIERKGKLSALGKLFKPWKWKRKKKSEKFEAASRSLERKISVRVPRDELVQKGILIESPTSIGNDFKPDKTDMQSVQQTNGACLTPSGEPPLAPSLVTPSVAVENCRPERPSSLAPGKLTRRLLCYHNDNTATRIMPDTAFCEGDKVCTPPAQMNSPLMLSELPEPPIPVSEIGPIPPPPMFSSPPSSTSTVTLPSNYVTTTQPVISTNLVNSIPADIPSLSYEALDCGGGGEDLHCEDISFEEDEYEEDDVDASELMRLAKPDPTIDTSKIEEIPAKEPKFHAVPLKSALKKPATPTQEIPSSAQISNRPVRFGLALPCTLENKENTRPFSDLSNENDTSDGPVLYRSDDSESRIAAKIARKDSLALKLALRPDRQELIDRNILQLQSEKERQENKEAVGARLIRRLSMRPTQEELEDRNILKKQSAAEEKKLKEEKKRMLLRKLSFRPTVEELKEKKIIRFNDYIEVTQAHDYDRRADKPWTRLTPKDKAAIRKELNEFKSSEMEVHQDSRHLTRFHRP